MTAKRISRAIERIELALTRIEAAAPNAPPPVPSHELQQLRERHQLLREKVEGAVLEIDRLLAQGESV